jgi:hypothetical protein
MRHDFKLRSLDADFLEQAGLPWESVRELKGTEHRDWVIIHDRPIPAGYKVATAKTALMLPGNYPDTQIDMVYFSPAVLRADGKEIKNLTTETILDVTFQRWSRHRTEANPWDPAEDSIETHLILVDLWLKTEFTRR